MGNSYASGANNGNVASQGIFAKGMGSAVTQWFTYDALNRLALAVEKPSNASAPVCPDTASNWCEGYTFDRYGNRTVGTSWPAGAPIQEPSGFDGASNRNVTPAGTTLGSWGV